MDCGVNLLKVSVKWKSIIRKDNESGIHQGTRGDTHLKRIVRETAVMEIFTFPKIE